MQILLDEQNMRFNSIYLDLEGPTYGKNNHPCTYAAP